MRRFPRSAPMMALAAVVLLTTTACGTTLGLLRDSVTTVEVKRANFKYIQKGVSASVKVHKLFCAIPLKNTPYKELMEQLHQQANLGPNQALVNFREDHALKAFVGFWCYVQYTLSADVIEFTPDNG